MSPCRDRTARRTGGTRNPISRLTAYRTIVKECGRMARVADRKDTPPCGVRLRVIVPSPQGRLDVSPRRFRLRGLLGLVGAAGLFLGGLAWLARRVDDDPAIAELLAWLIVGGLVWLLQHWWIFAIMGGFAVYGLLVGLTLKSLLPPQNRRM